MLPLKQFVLSVCLLLSIAVMGQSVSFPPQWKFIMDDQPLYQKIGYDDAQWALLPVPMSWGKLGINKEHSIGWYRVKLILPDSMLNKDLVLHAGIIDDADETYFNEHLVGSKGKFPPNDQTAWDVERKYLIKKEWVKKENIIVIRVYNGIGDGGITGGSPMITTKANEDKLVADQIKSKRSYYQFTTSNGLIAAVYNARSQTFEHIYPHIFSYYDSGLLVKPVINNLRLLQSVTPISTQYLSNTHIIEVKYPTFALDYFCSFTRGNKIFYAVARGKEADIHDIDFTYTAGEGRVELEKKLISRGELAEKYFLFGFSDTLNAMPLLIDEMAEMQTATLREKELGFMQHLVKHCKIPSGISKDERNTIEQSIAVLKMSQVSDKEIFPLSHGQLLASLRPGVWAISWVRDASFAIEAMSKLGMYAEAKKALEFMLQAAPTNQYVHYVHNDGKDHGIGVPYLISVTRYFGNGREESDFNAAGPNIELDDFGLFLTAFYHYVNESGDRAFFEKWENKGIDQICQAIIHNISEKHMIRAESGPWEHHLPGKEFVWTSGVCARGLQLIASLQKNYQRNFTVNETAGKQLFQGILSNCLINGKYFKGNATELKPTDHHYFDVASIELFANGLINKPTLFASHMAEYNKHNRAVHDPNRGYIRFNSADSYENQEWPFAGLRVAVAETMQGSKQTAKKLINRITVYANRNNNLIPEILTNEMSAYSGAIPMVGYGAGAYVLAVLAYYGKH